MKRRIFQEKNYITTTFDLRGYTRLYISTGVFHISSFGVECLYLIQDTKHLYRKH